MVIFVHPVAVGAVRPVNCLQLYTLAAMVVAVALEYASAQAVMVAAVRLSLVRKGKTEIKWAMAELAEIIAKLPWAVLVVIGGNRANHRMKV